MAEESSNSFTADKAKQVKVFLDNTPREEKLQNELNQANRTIGALLNQHKKEFEETIEPKPAPIGGDTAPLEPTEPRIVVDGSYIEPSWVNGDSPEEVISKVEHLSRVADNKADYQKIMSKLARKMLHGKPISIQFEGSLKDMVKSPKAIGEFDDEETKELKRAFNERLRANRTKWRQID